MSIWKASLASPVLSVFVNQGESTTYTWPTIQSWMLQPSATGPGVSNSTGFAATPE